MLKYLIKTTFNMAYIIALCVVGGLAIALLFSAIKDANANENIKIVIKPRGTACGAAAACSVISGNICRIYIPDMRDAKLNEAILKHEIAHCYGWRHDT